MAQDNETTFNAPTFPLMRIEMREDIDSDDEFWKQLARKDNPVNQCRRKMKSLRKQLEAQETLYNKMIDKVGLGIASKDETDSSVLEAAK